MIVLDASVLIAHLDSSDAHHEQAEQALAAVGDEEWGAATVTLAEMLVGPARSGRLDDATAALRTLCVGEIPFGPAAPTWLATLRARTGLRLPDCCVLLAAEDVTGTVLTFDERLRAAADRLGLGPS